MNRHLVVTELDERLFDSTAESAGFIERAVARALIAEAPPNMGGIVDLRPVVTFAANGNVEQVVRFVDAEGANVTTELDSDIGMLGLFSTATLISELNARAQRGDTDRGLDWVPVADVRVR